MKLSYDKDADALTLVFKKKKIIIDKPVSENVFAGFSKDGDLVELQILDISKADKTWLTVDLAAKILNKSERTILRWIKQGTLTARKVGKEYQISPESISELAS